MADAILRTDALTKRFHGIVATDNVHLSVMSGELHAIIGPNGAGKTTLLTQLAGELQPDSGTIFLDERDVTRLPVYRRAAIGLGRSYQITSVFLELTVLENVAFAVQARSGHSFRFFKPTLSDTSLTRPALTVADLVGLSNRMHVLAGDLSHGEQRQLEVAMLLATNPRVLLMDEPMAGMAPEEARRLVGLIQRLKRTLTIVLIEHDMDAVFALADRITVMFYGRAIVTDTVAAIRSNPEVKRVYFG